MHSQNKITIRKYFVLNQTGVRVILQKGKHHNKRGDTEIDRIYKLFLKN